MSPLNKKSPLDANPLAYITNEDLHSYSFQNLSDLLSVAQIRHLIALRRWATFLQSGAELQIHAETDTGVLKDTLTHNIEGIKNSISGLNSLTRSELVLRPVMCLDRIYNYRARSVFPEISVLLIGPRTEFEVLTALSYGIAPSNLRAVDLISYSPWIGLGDMHALPYADNSFDVIILGWVLSYTNRPKTVAEEILRVSKSDAVVSIGSECNTPESIISASKLQNLDQPQTVPDLLRLFGSAVGQVYFAHEPAYPKADLPGFTGHLIATFDLRK